MRSFKLRFLGRAAAFLLVLFIVFLAMDFLLVPAQSFTRLSLHEFYEQEALDTVFLGASHPLHGIDPVVIDDALGTKSFNLSSNSQKAMDSYYLLEEVYRYHTPQTVVLEVTYAMYTTYSGYRCV